MRILNLKLTDWGPHKSLDLDMDAPVVGLIGDNGSGKTNILSAIAFGFSGLLERPQESYVRMVDEASEEKPPPNAKVEITFRKGGIEGRIMRQVGKTASRKLWWDGAEKPLTKAADVEKLMGEILNCDRKALKLAVFLSQGHLQDFLFSNEAQREEEFARICMLDHLVKTADVAASEIQRVGKRRTDLTSQRDEALRSIEDRTTALRLVEHDLEHLKDRSNELEAVRSCKTAQDLEESGAGKRNHLQGVLREKETLLAEVKEPEPRSAQPAEEIDTISGRLTEIAKMTSRAELVRGRIFARKEKEFRIDTLQKELVNIGQKTQRLSAVSQALENKSAELKTLKEAQAGAVALDRLRGDHEQHTKRRASRAAELAGLPSAEADKANLAEIEKLTLELVPVLAGRRFALEHSEDPHVHACPVCNSKDLSGLPDAETCRREIAEIEGRLKGIDRERADISARTGRRETLLRDIAEIDGKLQELNAEMEAVPLFERVPSMEELQQLEEGIRKLERERGELLNEAGRVNTLLVEKTAAEKSLEDLPEAAAMEEELAKLEKETEVDTAALENRRSALQRWLKASEERKREVDAAKAALKDAGEELERLADKREKAVRAARNLVPGFDPARLEEALTGFKEECDRRNRKIGERDQAVLALRSAEGRLREIEQRMEHDKFLANLTAQLETLKGAFSRSGIQRRYLQRVFDILVARTQANLVNWDTDFQVEKDENTNKLFNFQFHRGHEPNVLLDQSQLSGGQRVRLALSFLQGAQQVIFPELDFLCVDEPSTHLDDAGVEGLARLFRSIGEHTSNNDSQVLVVDHRIALRVAFTKCHVLKPAAVQA